MAADAAKLLTILQPKSPDERLGWAIALAVALHAAAILGLSIQAPPRPAPASTLEVTLTQYKEQLPTHADFRAPTNQLGSGDATHPRELTTSESSAFGADKEQHVLSGTPTPKAVPAQNTVRELRVKADDATPITPPLDEPTDDALAGPPTDTPHLNLDVAHEVATMQARIDDASQWSAHGPRIRRITSVSAQSAAEAFYLSAWRRHVERIGNINYPDEARRQKLYGSLRLLVSIAADGTLKDVRILESSRVPALDQGALNIVRLAAPFPPFSNAMRRQMDVLEIIRTWQFRRSASDGDFSTEN